MILMDINAEKLRQIGDILGAELPEGYGFGLVVFTTGTGLREFRYISNCNRSDMAEAFESLVLKWKNEKDENN